MNVTAMPLARIALVITRALANTVSLVMAIHVQKIYARAELESQRQVMTVLSTVLSDVHHVMTITNFKRTLRACSSSASARTAPLQKAHGVRRMARWCAI